MKITKVSPFSGNVNTLDLPITEEQIAAWKNGMLIQAAFPDLTPGEREFLLTGITEAEWDATFGEED